MKKINLLIPILLITGLVACNDSDNPSSFSSTEPTTSVTPPSSSEDDYTIEDIKSAITSLVQNTNYTITTTDSDGDWVRRYLPNAYYYDAPGSFASKESIGYAENETGIFAFLLEEGASDIVLNPSNPYYLVDDNDENLHDIYSARTLIPPYYSTIGNLAYSFELVDLKVLDTLKESMAAPGMYDIDSKEMIKILTSLDQQNYYDASKVKTRIGFDKDGNIVIEYKGEWSQSKVVVSNIGTTNIPFILEYLASGKGAAEKPVDNSPTSKIKKLISGLNYKVTRDNSINYVVSDSYIHIVENDGSIHGFVVIPENNNSSLVKGVYEYTVDNNSFTLGKKTSMNTVNDSFLVMPKEIIDIVSWDDAKYAFYLSVNGNDSAFSALYPYHQYFHEDLYTNPPYYNTYVGELFITYDNLDDQSKTEITFLGKHYESNSSGIDSPTGNSNTIRMYDFNADTNKDFASPVETYLNSIVN